MKKFYVIHTKLLKSKKGIPATVNPNSIQAYPLDRYIFPVNSIFWYFIN